MPSKTSRLALAIALTALGVALFRPLAATRERPDNKETAFERVMRTQTIRCAYTVRPPHIMADPNTKSLSGIDYEVMEALGRTAGLKVDWQEQVGYGAFPEHLDGGKQDVFCSLVLVSASRARRVALTRPVSFMPLYVYVREGDGRFDSRIEALNDSTITMAVIDGSSQKAATDSAFPKARRHALPGDSDMSQAVLTVVTDKADALVADDNTIHDYNRRNPERKLRRVPSPVPLRTYGEAFAVGKNELALRDFLDAALQELAGNGVIDGILSNHEISPGALLRTAPPYTLPRTP